MPHQLNPNIETLFLLTSTPWDEKTKQEAIQELDATGVDGAALYGRNRAVIEGYRAAFEKEMVACEGTALLAEMEEVTLLVVLDLLWHHPEWVVRHHPEWVGGLDGVTDEALDAMVREQLVGTVGGQEDVIGGLEALGLTDRAKWQAMVLLQRPRQQLGAVFGAIARNLPAFEKARAAVAKELEALLVPFGELARTTYGSWPLDLTRVVGPSAPIIPMLAAPFAVLYLDNACLCGLLCYGLFPSPAGAFSKEELVVGAKVLSDQSKVDILLCLKEESLYGLEIAQKIGVTPATVSHHMGLLLAAGFVELEKRSGKVFYELSRKGIQKFLSGAGRLLL